VNSNGNDIKQLLEKYLNGTLSDAEHEQVEDWYRSFDQVPDNDDVFDNDNHKKQEYQFILANIHNRLDTNPKFSAKYSLYRKLYSSPVMKIAAILILVFFTATSLYYLKTVEMAGEALSLNTIDVKAGEMKTILLADGTKIWLNAATKFSYPKQFSSKSREVSLIEGEAFFEVAHDDKKPFIVHSKGINTQVLGTSFNISAYGYTKNVRVSVATGKVGVSSGKNLIGFLTPNEEISYGLVTKKYLKTITKSAGAMSWIKGEVVLEQVDFESLKEIIFDNYQYVISGDKKLNKLHFSATIKRTDSIISVMELISSINHTSYSLKNKTITMH
jgi:ferric-dicitrate binding protein FerR (iron transport regulator)